MNNDTSDGGATVPCISLFDITDLCQREGIELRGDDGKPYCCGERMNVRGGIIGPDFAECRKCGKAIGNVASPHINGGYIPSDEWIKENGNKTWYVLHTSNTKKGERTFMAESTRGASALDRGRVLVGRFARNERKLERLVGRSVNTGDKRWVQKL